MAGELSKNGSMNMSLQSFEPVDPSGASLMNPKSPDDSSLAPIPRPRKGTMLALKEIENLKADLASREEQIQKLQSQILQLEKSNLERDMEIKEKQNLQEKVTDLEDQLSLMSLTQAPKEKGPKRSDMIIIQRLEKAMKEKSELKQELTQLKAVNLQLKEQVAKVSETQLKEAEEERERLRNELDETRDHLQAELKTKTDDLEAKKQVLKVKYDTEIAQLKQTSEELNERTQKLERDCSEKLQMKELELSDAKAYFEKTLKSTEDTLHNVQSELKGCQSELTEMRETENWLRAQAAELKQLKIVMEEKHAKRIRDLETDVQRMSEELDTTNTTLSAKEEQCKRYQNQLSKEVAEKQRIHTEMKDLESTCNDFQKEAEAALTDYDEASENLKRIEQDRDNYRKQANNCLRELSVRNTQLNEMEKELKRYKEIETERTIMSHQLKVFEDDYLSERRAREELVKKCTSLRERNQQLEQEKKGLQMQLNEQAQLAAQYAMEFEHSSDPDDPSAVPQPNYQTHTPQWS